MSERLYNGIVLPDEWPPRYMDPQSEEPMPVPYLDNPPEVIPIDIGRQLFVDDFLIEETALQRVYHKPERYAGNPVLEAKTEFETRIKPRVGLQQGGVFYNPDAGRYEMFYHSGTLDPRCRHMAVSPDMVNWERPDFGHGAGNMFREPGPDGKALPPDTPGAVFAVWLDLEAKSLEEKYKLINFNRKNPRVHTLHTSPDGVNWSKPVLAGPAGDAQSFFYNPFRKVWVYSIKRHIQRNGHDLRARWYAEHPVFLEGNDWTDAVYWTCADRLDRPEPAAGYPAYPAEGGSCQLYALHGVAYESIMLGMHEIHRGPENSVCNDGDFPKLTDIDIGFSRDGFHWHRPDRSGFIRSLRHEGPWDRAYLHSTTSICVIKDDQLVFPYSGYSGFDPDGTPGMYNGGAIGIAALRRDGLASMRAGEEEKTLLTRTVTFRGKHLFVNIDAPEGLLTVEVCSKQGEPLPGFTKSDCFPIAGDSTKMMVKWKGDRIAGEHANRPVRFRFHLTKGDLYSFWLSGSESGESGGYVAGGGPGFTGNKDN